MKICIVCDVLGEENNGTTIAAMNLIRSLKTKGHEVRVICPSHPLYNNKEGFYTMPIIHLPKALNNIVVKNNVVIGRFDRKIMLKAFDGVDLVHVMFPLFMGPKCARYAKTILNLPVTCGFHCQAENLSSHFFGLMDSNFFNRLVYKNYYKKMYRYADIIHYPTEFIKKTFEEVVGPTNGEVISNGVQKIFEKREVSKPKELENKKTILFIGRISKEKSHSILIKAVPLSKYKNDIQLVFAGQGPRLKEVQKLSQKLLPNQPIIKFFTHDELVNIINAADLYVHPAEVEIEAISCLEAIKCGLVPVINNSPKSATKYFALDERSLFNFNDHVDLAKKIDYWFDHPEEKAKMSQRYAESAVKFDFDTCMDRMEEMLNRAIELCKEKNE